MKRTLLLTLALIGCDDADDSARSMADAGPTLDMAAPDARPVDVGAPDIDADATPDAAVDMAAPPDAAPDAAPNPDAAPPDQGPPPCDPVPERCNGLDDDCDEAVDEGYDVDAPCGQGVGACRAVARVVCAEDGTATCPAVAGAPRGELCNGLDDDCDGRTDEDYDADGDGAPRCEADVCAACPVEDPEVCRALCDGQDCRDENLGVFPAAEDRCGDGIDQNCDGEDAPCTVATGRIATLAVAPGDAPACPDVNGDGAPDNAMSLLGALANEALAQAVADGQVNLFLAAEGLAAPGTEGNFRLAVLLATPEGVGYAVDPAGLTEDGAPRILFPGARVRDAALRAGPGRLTLDLPIADLALTLVLYQARVQGTLGVDDSLGLSLADGVLWGAVTDADLQAALDGLEATCAAADPAPAFCGPLAMFRPLLGNLLVLDQDLDQDGVRDAYSICLSVGATPEVLMGWPPE